MLISQHAQILGSETHRCMRGNLGLTSSSGQLDTPVLNISGTVYTYDVDVFVLYNFR